jgi:hypothetical protein
VNKRVLKNTNQGGFADSQKQMAATQQNNYPKVTFEAKELFEQAQLFTQKVPYWKKNSEHPVYQYVPVSERPFQTGPTEDEVRLAHEDTMRVTRVAALAGKDRSL